MFDYNIDILQYKQSSLSNDFINMMISNSFLPYVLQPTRVTIHSGTVIDNIFSNVTDCQTVSGNLTTLISDHFVQFFIIKKIYFIQILMISNSFLPYVLQPTRVTIHSGTVIDNIFSNVTDCQTVSIIQTIQILEKKNLFMTALLLIGLLSVIHRFLLMTILTIYMKKLLNVSILMYQRRKSLKIPET